GLVKEAGGAGEGGQGAPSLAEAETADAEDRRLVGDADAGTWAAVADGWRAVRRPYLIAYARAREAEAHLVAGERAAAEGALREADTIAAELGARPLRGAIASLAARGRIDLEAAAEPAETAAEPHSVA